jgi:hypothetical protein
MCEDDYSVVGWLIGAPNYLFNPAKQLGLNHASQPLSLDGVDKGKLNVTPP